MPEFWYTALAADGSVREGWFTAPDEQDVDELVRSTGAHVVRIEQRPRPEQERFATGRTDGRVDRSELLAFLEYVSGAIEVGIPLLEALHDVRERVQSRRLSTIIGEVSFAIGDQGKSLSDALAEHPKAFPELYIGTIRAGEASGNVAYALQQLVEYLDWQEGISSQLQQATMYPAIVLSAVGLLVMGLLGFVFPRILPLLRMQKVGLPLPTRIILALSFFVRQYWLMLVVIAVVGGVLVWLYRRTPRGRLVLDGLTLRIPIVGPIVRDVNIARLVTYLSLFYRTGVEIVLSLTICERIITNRVIANAVGEARRLITGGTAMAEAFGVSPLFPALVRRSIALGESTGKLDESLGRARDYYAREIPATVRRLITVLQPMLIVLIGGVILMVALAIILPILNIYNTIGIHR